MEEEILNNLTDLPHPTQNVIKYTWEKVLPKAHVFPKNDLTPIEINIEGREGQYIDTKNIKLCVKGKVKNRTGAGIVEDLRDEDYVVPYNNLMHAMWEDISVDMNNIPVSKSWKFYDLISFIKMQYMTPNEAKKNLLTSSFWYQDAPGGHDVFSNIVGAVVPPGERARNHLAANSAEFGMEGKLLVDVLNSKKPVPESVDISLKFYPNEGKKYLMSPLRVPLVRILDPFFQITDMFLMVPRITVKNSLLKKPVVIPYKKYDCLRLIFPPDVPNFGPRNILTQDVMPNKCMVVLWTDDQLNGTYQANRNRFHHYNATQVLVRLNNEHLPHFEGLKADWTGERYDEVYHAVFDNLGDTSTIDINKTDFKNGFVIWAFDLTQKNLSEEYYPSKRKGSLDISMRFDPAPILPIAILCILESERKLTFDKNRSVTESSGI